MLCCGPTTATATSPSTPAPPKKLEDALKVQPPADGIAPPAVEGYVAAALLSSLPQHGLAEYDLSPDVPICLVMKRGALMEGALLSICPHKQASLAQGDIEEGGLGGGCAVKCPRHRSKFPGGLNFDVTTGRNWTGPGKGGNHPEYSPQWSVPVFRTAVGVDGAGRKWAMVSNKPVIGSLPRAVKGTAKAKELASELKDMGTAGSFEELSGVSPPPPVLAVHLRERHEDGGGDGRVEGSVGGPHPPRAWTAFSVQSVRRATHDAVIFTLTAAGGCGVGEGLHAGPDVDPHCWHVSVAVGAPPGPGLPPPALSREYTPLSSLSAYTFGSLSLLVKLYPRGKLTSLLAQLTPGDVLSVSPPETTLSTPALLPPAEAGAFSSPVAAPAPALPSSAEAGDVSGSSLLDITYTHAGAEEAGQHVRTPDVLQRAALRRLPVGVHASIAVVAGGTGVTPALQVVRWALGLEAPPSSVPGTLFLLLCNKTAGDVLAREAVAQLAAESKGRLVVVHALTRGGDAPALSPLEASGGVRFVTTGRPTPDMVRLLVPDSTPLARVIVSGPAGMFDTVRAAFIAAGHAEEVLVELDA